MCRRPGQGPNPLLYMIFILMDFEEAIVSEESDPNRESDGETKTEGAIKAGDGRYYFDLEELYEAQAIDAGPGYSTANGPVIEGERAQVGLIHKPEGTGSRLHTHPNEQFYYVVQGTLQVKVEDNEPFDVNTGEAAYVPPDTEHWSIAAPGTDEDVFFFVVKDLRHKIYGTAVDDSTDEAQYVDGYEPDDE